MCGFWRKDNKILVDKSISSESAPSFVRRCPRSMASSSYASHQIVHIRFNSIYLGHKSRWSENGSTSPMCFHFFHWYVYVCACVRVCLSPWLRWNGKRALDRVYGIHYNFYVFKEDGREKKGCHSHGGKKERHSQRGCVCVQLIYAKQNPKWRHTEYGGGASPPMTMMYM